MRLSQYPLLLLLISLPQAVLAIDPGRVQGSFQMNDKAITLTQAYALLHDNAEGLLDFPKELRLLLVDREVPQESLAGIGFLPVEQIAREGKVRGLLLRLDPNDHKHLLVTLLFSPTDPGQTLLTRAFGTTSQKVPIELKIGNFNRVSGIVEHYDKYQPEVKGVAKLDYSLRFSAPLFHERSITAILKGQAAKTSPQMRVFAEKIRALEKGDLESAERLSTASATLRTRNFLAQVGPERESWEKQAAAKMKESIKDLQRVVVRGDRAVMVFGTKQWHNFVKEGGEWKSDN
jgi:hypothetical protein